jgi:hypothetical protein
MVFWIAITFEKRRHKLMAHFRIAALLAKIFTIREDRYSPVLSILHNMEG